MATASDVLRIARAEVGYDRYSWVLDQAKVECAGIPGAYCPSIHHKQTLTAAQLKAGDVVLFDWEDDGTDDHVGLVVSNDTKAKTVKTIEGNTSGGKVAERTRAYSTICGGIRPSYTDSAATPSTAAKEVTRELVSAVADGKYGNGDSRTKKLKAEGYDPAAVQLAVNAYLRGEAFGAAKPAEKKAKYEITTPSGVTVRKGQVQGAAGCGAERSQRPLHQRQVRGRILQGRHAHSNQDLQGRFGHLGQDEHGVDCPELWRERVREEGIAVCHFVPIRDNLSDFSRF